MGTAFNVRVVEAPGELTQCTSGHLEIRGQHFSFVGKKPYVLESGTEVELEVGVEAYIYGDLNYDKEKGALWFGDDERGNWRFEIRDATEEDKTDGGADN